MPPMSIRTLRCTTWSGTSSPHSRLDRPDLLGLMLKAGADITLRGRGKKTALDIAEELKFTEIAGILKSTQALYDWLEGLEMERYKLLFMREGLWLDVLATDKSITTEYLEEIGLRHKKDRKRIITGIEELILEIQQNPGAYQNSTNHKDRLTVQLSKLTSNEGEA